MQIGSKILREIKDMWTLQVEKLKWLYIFQIVYLLTVFILLRPICDSAMEKLLHRYGYSYITSENMLCFFTKLPVVSTILVFLFVLVIVVFLGIVFSFQYIGTIFLEKGKVSLAGAFVRTCKCIKRIFLERQYACVPLIVETGLFYAGPVLLFFAMNIPTIHYVLKRLFFLKSIKISLFCIAIFCIFWLVRNAYTLAYFFTENSTLKQAKTKSRKEIWKKPIATLGNFFGWSIYATALCGVFYCVIIGIMIFLVLLFTSETMHIAVFCAVQEKISFPLFFFFSLLSITLQIVGNVYYICNNNNFYSVNQERKERKENRKTVFKVAFQKKYFIGAILFILIVDSFAIYDTIINGKLNNWGKLGKVEITAHRGASFQAPENTLPAIEHAISQKPDCIEIDVQLTKDGEVVLMHDSLMTRTTGISNHVYDLDYDAISALDAGGWYAPEYAGTPIPTLEEVIQLCKGHCKLNIEIKEYEKKPEIVKKVVDLIKKYDFTRQCVVTSVYKKALSEVKEYHKEIQTGYILSSAYGRYYLDKDIDFLSMRASMVTERIVLLAHKYGKEIYVWTVNSKKNALYMSQLGVDNIITDCPSYIKSTLYEEHADPTLLSLLRLSFKYK